MAISLLNSCQHFQETIKFDIDLEFNENNKTSILFETKPGCSKTNFKFTEIFSKEIELERYNCFIASNFIEYENTIKKYFEMDFFNTITQEYFNDNNLVILIFRLNDEDILKNGKFIKNNDNKYIFEIDVWDNGTPILFRKKCVYDKILILEIGKTSNSA
jgi:hypothetical protein